MQVTTINKDNRNWSGYYFLIYAFNLSNKERENERGREGEKKKERERGRERELS